MVGPRNARALEKARAAQSVTELRLKIDCATRAGCDDRQMVCTTIEPASIASVSPRLRSATPSRTKTKLSENVLVDPGRRIFSVPEAAARQAYTAKRSGS